MAQLVLELFSEEIPARMQTRASADLKRLIIEALKAAGLSFDKAVAYATPRRIALVVDGLPDAQPDMSEEKRGPRTDAPDKAVDGFLRANGVTLEECERRVAGKGEFWFAVIERKGWPTVDVLVDILPDAIRKLPWQKSMRWGEGTLRWVRPLQRILCVLDAKTVLLDIGDNVPCGNVTSGHRFLRPEPFEVGFFDDYEKTLWLNKVVLHTAHRRQLIEQRANELVKEHNAQVKWDTALLAEVAGLVEWPVALLGNIDNEFMVLPEEVLSTSMRSHQKYFSVVRKDGKLAPLFVVVANLEAADGGAAIVAGNERVLRARLSDAKFFWDQDRRESLESRVPALAHMAFHQKLGTLENKVTRITALATEIAQWVPGADRSHVSSAATLCKADLTTGMVGEFAELQGIMGRYYALAQNEAPEVADAIAEHYSPAGPDDECPTKPVSIAVALADKIDTLAGFWAIEEKPTGSRDPFALRRAALGVIRIILENELTIPLRQLFSMAYLPIGSQLEHDTSTEFDYMMYLARKHLNSEELEDGNIEGLWEREGIRSRVLGSEGLDVSASLIEFFADRLKVHLRGKGIRHDLVAAVFSVGNDDDLLRLVKKANALRDFLETDDGANILAAYKRATNIVAIEEKRDNKTYTGEVDLDLIIAGQQEEKNLHEYLGEYTPEPNFVIEFGGYHSVMLGMSKLRIPVDEFFENVTVNCDDSAQRQNRLNLLSRFRATLGQIADFSQIEG